MRLWVVQSSLGRSRFPDFRCMTLEFSRAMGHFGSIWRYMVIFFLVLVLRWADLKMVEKDLIVDSCNKAWVRGDTLGRFDEERFNFHLPCRHGRDMERILVDVIEGGFSSDGNMNILQVRE